MKGRASKPLSSLVFLLTQTSSLCFYIDGVLISQSDNGYAGERALTRFLYTHACARPLTRVLFFFLPFFLISTILYPSGCVVDYLSSRQPSVRITVRMETLGDLFLMNKLGPEPIVGGKMDSPVFRIIINVSVSQLHFGMVKTRF
jgi:hypothetical protein